MGRWYNKRGTGVQTKYPIKNYDDIVCLLSWFEKMRDISKSESKKYKYDRDYFFFLLGINFAFRTEDLLKLRSCDLENGYVTLRENKTGKVQNFPIHHELYDEYKKYVERNGITRKEYIFSSQKGKGIKKVTRQQMNNELDRAAKINRIPIKLSCYSLRKTFAYQYLANGGSIETLRKLLNHSSTEVTARYACWGDDDVERERREFYIGYSIRTKDDAKKGRKKEERKKKTR